MNGYTGRAPASRHGVAGRFNKDLWWQLARSCGELHQTHKTTQSLSALLSDRYRFATLLLLDASQKNLFKPQILFSCYSAKRCDVAERTQLA